MRWPRSSPSRTATRLRPHAMAARAFECWTKISPLGKTEGESSRSTASRRTSSRPTSTTAKATAGRGGWSWYTGSAARMLSAAYAIIGLKLENGQVQLPEDLLQPRGRLKVNKVWIKGQTWDSAEATETAEVEPA